MVVNMDLIGTDCTCTFPGTGTEPNSYGYVGRKLTREVYRKADNLIREL